MHFLEHPQPPQMAVTMAAPPHCLSQENTHFSLVASSLAFVTHHQKPLVSCWVWWLMSLRPELRRLKRKEQGQEKPVFRGDS